MVKLAVLFAIRVEMPNLYVNTCVLFAILNFTRDYGSSFISSNSNEILFFIISQDTNYHRNSSENLRNSILEQAETITDPKFIIRVKFLHEITNGPGYWTILLALPQLLDPAVNIIDSCTTWIIFCEGTTIIKIKPLLTRLLNENHTEIFYLGHGLHDRDATVIHHYGFFENPTWFSYPLLCSGIIFSVPLIKRIAQQVEEMRIPRSEFSIDASYELALFIMENIHNDGGNNNNSDSLTKPNKLSQEFGADNALKSDYFREAEFICSATPSEQQELCFLQAPRFKSSPSIRVNRNTIYFAIKTYHKYHQDRIPIIENTWGPLATHKRYFSDIEGKYFILFIEYSEYIESFSNHTRSWNYFKNFVPFFISPDKNVPTTSTGVPNADIGHCSKTLSILNFAFKDIESLNDRYQWDQPIQWLFLSDDDTILSVAGVCDILSHFNSSDDIYLGERYGYRLYAKDGFNYITGGGGIALSLSVVKKIIKHCTCPAITAPDDMVLGSCMHALQIKTIHSSRFHQGRPCDYPPALFQIEKPISFHKFWQLDPVAMYKEWFADDDKKMVKLESDSFKLNKSISQRLVRRKYGKKRLKAGPRKKKEERQLGRGIDYDGEILLKKQQIEMHFDSGDIHLDL